MVYPQFVEVSSIQMTDITKWSTANKIRAYNLIRFFMGFQKIYIHMAFKNVSNWRFYHCSRCPDCENNLEEPFFFLLGVSWSDHFYIPVGNTTGNGDSEKHMDVILAIIVSSKNSSPSCHFLDRCYCICLHSLVASTNFSKSSSTSFWEKSWWLSHYCYRCTIFMKL